MRYRYDGSDNENASTTEYFNASLARFAQDYSKNLTSNHRLTSNFRFEWKPDTMTNIIFRPNLTYQRNRGRGYSTSGSYSDQLMEMVVNTNTNRNMSINTNTNLSGELQLNRKLGNKGRNVTSLTIRRARRSKTTATTTRPRATSA